MIRPVAAVISIPLTSNDDYGKKRRDETTARDVSVRSFLANALKIDATTVKHSSRERFFVPDGNQHREVQKWQLSKGRPLDSHVRPMSLLFQTLHDAYDLHRPVSLAPEVIWYAITHEIAITVRRNTERYAHLYTSEPAGKQTINIDMPGAPWDDDGHWINGFSKELKARVPEGSMDHSLLSFSTSTMESDVATLISFMDAASPFYEYSMTTCCGIPQVRLEGTPEDWQLIVVKAQFLAEAFSQDLSLYFQHLIPVLSKLAQAAAGKDVGSDFWQSMVKIDGGSGGPYG